MCCCALVQAECLLKELLDVKILSRLQYDSSSCIPCHQSGMHFQHCSIYICTMQHAVTKSCSSTQQHLFFSPEPCCQILALSYQFQTSQLSLTSFVYAVGLLCAAHCSFLHRSPHFLEGCLKCRHKVTAFKSAQLWHLCISFLTLLWPLHRICTVQHTVIESCITQQHLVFSHEPCTCCQILAPSLQFPQVTNFTGIVCKVNKLGVSGLVCPYCCHSFWIACQNAD